MADEQQRRALGFAFAEEQLEESRAAVHEARVKTAELEAKEMVLQTRLKVLSEMEASGGAEVQSARAAETAMSGQLLQLQELAVAVTRVKRLKKRQSST